MDNSSQSLIDICAVITESNRIINAHSRHFLALSVLFLLPLSFSLSVFPTLLHTFTSPSPNHIVSLLRTSSKTTPIHLHPPLPHTHTFLNKTLIFTLIFSSFFLFFTLLALSSITSSVFHGFYGRPVKLKSTITSLLRSFFPLLLTFIAAFTVVSISLVFSPFGVLGLGFLGFVNFEVNFNGLSSICEILLGLVLIYLAVNWVLVSVIVVVESKWGFEPMVRSAQLVKGMRWVALSLIMFFGFFEVVLLWISMVSGVDAGVAGAVQGGWYTWVFAVRIVVTSAVLTLVLLHGIAATTVLYMYCKALHGELAGEIAHEFAAEYLSLPFDDKKVPHVVCYVC